MENTDRVIFDDEENDFNDTEIEAAKGIRMRFFYRFQSILEAIADPQKTPPDIIILDHKIGYLTGDQVQEQIQSTLQIYKKGTPRYIPHSPFSREEIGTQERNGEIWLVAGFGEEKRMKEWI